MNLHFKKHTTDLWKSLPSLILIYFIITTFFVSTQLTIAQTVKSPSENDINSQYTLLEPLPCIPGNGVVCKDGLQKTIDFATYVQYIFNLIIAISAVAAVLVMVAGGFKYVTTDSFSDKSDGKKMIFEALKGLLLVLCSFLILRTIDPRLVSIPTTIVKPLEIKNVPSSSYGFFEQLASEASKYRIETAELIAARTRAHAEVTASEARIESLEAKMATLSEQLEADDPQLKELEIEIQKEKDIITSQKYNLLFTQKMAIVTSILNSYTNSFDFTGDEPVSKISEYSLESLQKHQSALNQAYNDGVVALQNMGNPKEKVEQLNNAFKNVNANIILLKNTPQYSTNLDTSISIIKLRVLDVAINTITDESIKISLKQKAENLIQQLEIRRDELRELDRQEKNGTVPFN